MVIVSFEEFLRQRQQFRRNDLVEPTASPHRHHSQSRRGSPYTRDLRSLSIAVTGDACAVRANESWNQYFVVRVAVAG